MNKELLPNDACPACGQVGQVSRITRREAVPVRDLSVEVTRVFRSCGHCGTEFESTADPDWKKEAYAAYRTAKGMPSPEDIRAWRKEYDLTQPEVTRLLGWGEVTLGRYENGSLQSDAHNRSLMQLMDPVNLVQALESDPEAVPEAKRAAIFDKVDSLVTAQRARQLLATVVSRSAAGATTGHRAFNIDRLSALVRFITTSEGVFRTKLNKLLFYIDFCAFAELGRSVTGLQYARLNYGPVPNKFDTIFDCLQNMGTVTIESWEVGDYAGGIIRAAGPVPHDLLSREEKLIANAVCEHFNGWTAVKVMDFSHEEKAWLEVPNSKLISYEFAKGLQIRDRLKLPPLKNP